MSTGRLIVLTPFGVAFARFREGITEISGKFAYPGIVIKGTYGTPLSGAASVEGTNIGIAVLLIATLYGDESDSLRLRKVLLGVSNGG